MLFIDGNYRHGFAAVEHDNRQIALLCGRNKGAVEREVFHAAGLKARYKRRIPARSAQRHTPRPLAERLPDFG